MAKEEGTFTIIWKNQLAPYMHGIQGPLLYVALEVLVGKLLRRFMGTNYSFTYLTQVHLLSLPFLGPVHAFFNPAFSATLADADAKMSDHIKDGAKGIPAVILAECVLRVFSDGFKFPRIAIKDLGVTAVAKTITRPISAQLYKYMPEDQATQMDVFEALIMKAATASRMFNKDERVKLKDSEDLQASSTVAQAEGNK